MSDFGVGFYQNELLQRMGPILGLLAERRVLSSKRLDGFVWKPAAYKSGSDMPVIDDSFKPLGDREVWSEKADAHAWFYSKVDFGQSDRRVELLVNTNHDGWDAVNPQFMLYVDGRLKQGMDVNHTTCVIRERGEHEVYLYGYSGYYSDVIMNAFVREIDEDTDRLYYNVLIPFETLKTLHENDHSYAKILQTLNATLNYLDMREWPSEAFSESVKRANAYIEEEFYGKICALTDEKVACVGHTHIDIAWKWTVAQTIEKAQRSFATVTALMERYPEYKFTSSQPVLYKAVKEECPELYERIKKLVAAGRWEVEGGMWVEADCNLTSGESLVRQFLYGKRFMKEEFDVDSKVLWLPDVFGYSAALPQILKKCGINDFVTSKISWNETNVMPYDCFTWVGIDGTEMPSHFITTQDIVAAKRQPYGISAFTTYVSKAEPKMVAGAYHRYQQKFFHNEALMTVGFGDGGGGTVPYDVESVKRLSRGIPGMPTAEFKSVADYISGVHKSVDGNRRLPRWQGELYLECHRGTYTSQAKNKLYNRRGEFLLQNTETVGVIGELLCGAGYDKEGLRTQWETALLNQFHDIIPGSSIREVYEQTDKEYAELMQFGAERIDAVLQKLAEGADRAGLLVYNPTPFPYTGAVSYEGKRYFVTDIPAKGFAVVDVQDTVSAVAVTDKTIENELYKLTFDGDMNICSVYDKTVGRELLKEDRVIAFRAYEDLPKGEWEFDLQLDAWELQRNYVEHPFDVNEVISVEKVTEADRAGLKITRKFGKSTITDTVLLYDREGRIDFIDDIDWQANHVLLKREFPLDIVTDKATCEIQFGSAERPVHANTSWDAAKFEVCAHKYVDLSEADYGVALLNDCKYGHSVQNCDISLSLLRAPTYPDPTCDLGKHSMRYALYPHKNAVRASDVAAEAYRFNDLCYAVKTEGKGQGLSNYSLVNCSNPNVFVDTVKLAEDGDDIILRMYEANCTRGRATLTFGFDVKKIALADMMENETETLAVENNSVTVDVKPFEIITLKIKK